MGEQQQNERPQPREDGSYPEPTGPGKWWCIAKRIPAYGRPTGWDFGEDMVDCDGCRAVDATDPGDRWYRVYVHGLDDPKKFAELVGQERRFFDDPLYKGAHDVLDDYDTPDAPGNLGFRIRHLGRRAVAAEAERDAKAAECEGLRAERDQWKANHDEMVRRNALLRNRPDLPLERVCGYDAMDAEIGSLRERAERAEAKVAEVEKERAASPPAPAAAEQEGEVLTREELGRIASEKRQTPKPPLKEFGE